jgi:hypothetical protein
MNKQPNKEFLINYVGITDIAPYEQDQILTLLWNAIHNRIFDKLKMYIDEEILEKYQMQFETDREGVLFEIKEIVPEWDDISSKAAKEVIEEFKKVRETMKS